MAEKYFKRRFAGDYINYTILNERIIFLYSGVNGYRCTNVSVREFLNDYQYLDSNVDQLKQQARLI